MTYQWVDPKDADWYVEVVFEGADGETDYNYAYFAGDRPDVRKVWRIMRPDGSRLLESTVKATAHGAHADQWRPEADDE